MKVVCPKCRKPVDQVDLEVHAAACKGAAEPKARKARVVKNPAQYVIFKEYTPEELSMLPSNGDKVLVAILTAKGPALARKEVEKQKIAGTLACYRGPVWRERYGVQEVFGIVDEK
jgi:hypothetical protein